jgi:hypothetical protein
VRNKRRGGGGCKCQGDPGGTLASSGSHLFSQIAGRLRPLRVDEFETHVADVSPPTRRIFLQATGEHTAHVRRRRGRQPAPVGLARENRCDGVGGRRAGKGEPAGDHLEEHAAERPDVRTLVDGLTARLLGAHIAGRAHDRACVEVAGHDRRQVRLLAIRPGRERLRQAEVERFDVAVWQEG